MDMNAAFPSENLKAADLSGNERTLTIDKVTIEMIGDDQRPVVHFQGEAQRLVLNKTNSNTIIGMHGAESDHWTGRQITLFPTYTDFGGKQVACIRVKPVVPQHVDPNPPIPTSAPPTPDQVQGLDNEALSDSDIPFN